MRYFDRFFSSPPALRSVCNTRLLGVYNLLWSFPASIPLALLFNEHRKLRLKRLVQTVSYYLNFVSQGSS